MKKIIETPRLYLRELTLSDKNDLSKVLSDKQSMIYYPHTFSEKEVINWINRNIDNYKKYNYGLWAVILKSDNTFLGDCGITMQNIGNDVIPEIGYHIRKEYCNQGYATEAARACKEYAFNKLKINKIYTITSIHNKPSIKVAEKNGMKKIKILKKLVYGVEVETAIYAINSQDYRNKS